MLNIRHALPKVNLPMLIYPQRVERGNYHIVNMPLIRTHDPPPRHIGLWLTYLKQLCLNLFDGF